MSDEAPDFLDLEDVLELHALQLARYGGAAGVRDRGLLESRRAEERKGSDAKPGQIRPMPGNLPQYCLALILTSRLLSSAP